MVVQPAVFDVGCADVIEGHGVLWLCGDKVQYLFTSDKAHDVVSHVRYNAMSSKAYHDTYLSGHRAKVNPKGVCGDVNTLEFLFAMAFVHHHPNIDICALVRYVAVTSAVLCRVGDVKHQAIMIYS
jgi:hypothetical protein